MMSAHTDNTDPYEIDVLDYLADLNDDLSAKDRREHYAVLIPILSRIQIDDPATFDLALKEISKILGIKAKTVKADLDALRESPTNKEARELLEKMGQTRILRLAQDFVDGQQWFGIMAGDDKLLLSSDGELRTLDKVPDGLIIKDNGFDYCRLSKEAILHFLSGGTADGPTLLADLRQFFTRFAVFREKGIPLLLAIWTLGTYCYRIFRVFAYLALRSPDKRCGKSRVLDLLFLLAFNASPKTVHPTEAQLFRSPSRNGGALLLDEVEALGKADKDIYAGLLAVLNSGFEQNGMVERQVKDANGNFKGVSFETYCPHAIAGINRTAETLEDRSIMILMQRKLAREKTERFSPSRLEKEAQALRDRCYLWALTHAPDLAAVYEQADKFFPALDTLDDRARDLWEPLVSRAAIIDVERADKQKTVTEELTGLASALCQVRDGAAEDSTTVRVVQALQRIVVEKQHSGLFGENGVKLTPTELAGLLKAQLGWEKLSTKSLASLLNPLGLYSTHARDDDKDSRSRPSEDDNRGRRYCLTEAALKELAERYGEQAKSGGKKPNEA